MWFFVLTISLIFTVYLYLTRNFRYWEKRNVPFIPPSVFFGNFAPIFTLQKHISEYLQEIYDKYNNLPFIGLFSITTPVLFVRDLDLIKAILIKDFHVFPGRNFCEETNYIREPIYLYTLFSLKGPPWKEIRPKLTSCFTRGKMKHMTHFMLTCVKQLENVIEQRIQMEPKNSLILKQIMSQYTSDVISNCIFGIEGCALTNPESDGFYKMGSVMFNPSSLRALKVYFAILGPTNRFLKMLPIRQNKEAIYKICRNAVWKTIHHREANNIFRDDFMDALRQLRDKNVIDGDNLVAQAFVFILAGYETSSSLMSFAVYELAKNLEIQERARKEVRECLKKYNMEMTYECISDMIYVEQVLKETLRMYPPLSFLDRICVKEYQLPGTEIKIDPGTKILISASSIHMDPKYYANPKQFNPENFSQENIQKRDKCTFLAFGEGPKNCIGERFGMLQSKMGIASLLNKFRISECDETPKIISRYDVKSVASSPEVPLKVVFEKL